MNKIIFLLKAFSFSFLLFILIFLSGFGTQKVFAAATKPVGGPGLGTQVFGWAWGATNEGMTGLTPNFGVGWIKLNSCDDLIVNTTGLPGFDGIADPGSCGSVSYAITIDPSNGIISGNAWSSNVGWISFNRSETGNPPFDDPGTCASENSCTGQIAKANMSNGVFTGQIRGWARAISADGNGWDGWIHLSDTSSSPSYHPSGPSYIDGSKGVTYNESAGAIVGSAWGSEVVGWIKFVNATYRAPVGNSFTYYLTNNGPITIHPGGPAGIVRIDRHLTSGPGSPVTITSSVPNTSEVLSVVSGVNNPCTPNPTCYSEISFTAVQGAPSRTHSVNVTGNLDPGHSTTFNVVVAPATQNTLNVECSVQGNPPFLINNSVTWQTSISGGVPPYTVNWQFINDPANEAGGYVTGTVGSNMIERTYTKVGKKTAIALVIDSSSPEQTGTCQNAAEINVVVKPSLIER